MTHLFYSSGTIDEKIFLLSISVGAFDCNQQSLLRAVGTDDWNQQSLLTSLKPLFAINTCFQEPLGLMIAINSHF